MSLLAQIAFMMQGAAPTPPPVISPNKNVQTAAFSTDGGYWSNGSAFALDLWMRRGDDHMDGGAEHRVPFDKYLTDPYATPVQTDTPIKQTDDVAACIANNGDIITSTMESDHGTGPDHWASDVWQLKFDGVTKALISKDLITDLITNYVSIGPMEYEFVYNFNTAPDTGHIYGGFVQLDIETGTPGQGRFSVIRSTDNGNSYTQFPVFSISPTDTSQSEFLVTPLSGGNISCMLRLDQGGPWRHWISTNDCASFAFAGSTLLGWQATREKVNRCFGRNSRGLYDFWVADRDTGWMVCSFDNTEAGILANTFNPIDLFYYKPQGSHTILGYNAGRVLQNEDVGVTGIDHVGWSQEAVSNTFATWLYTNYDNIDKTPPPTPPAGALSESFVTSTSFRLDFDMDTLTDEEMQNIRYFKFGFYTDAGFTTPVMGKYYYNQTPPVSLADFRANAHFINADNLTTGSGATIYVRMKICNNIGESSYLTYQFNLA